MNKDDQLKSLAIALEDADNPIRRLTAQQHNHEVQISDYRQIVKELSDKLKLYEKMYGTVFKNGSSQS